MSATHDDDAFAAEQAAEIWAENAWLRAAENAIPQADLDYEAAREAEDPFLLWLAAEREASNRCPHCGADLEWEDDGDAENGPHVVAWCPNPTCPGGAP